MPRNHPQTNETIGEEEIKMKKSVLKTDVVTKNGDLYPKKVIEEMQVAERIWVTTGFSERGEIVFDSIIGEVKSCELVGDVLKAEIKLDESVDPSLLDGAVFRTGGIGKVERRMVNGERVNEVRDFRLDSIALIPKDQDTFAEEDLT